MVMSGFLLREKSAVDPKMRWNLPLLTMMSGIFVVMSVFCGKVYRVSKDTLFAVDDSGVGYLVGKFYCRCIGFGGFPPTLRTL